MVLPPWTLISPEGIVQCIANEEALRELSRSAAAPSMRDLRDLVDVRNKATHLHELPSHRNKWCLMERMQWLQSSKSGQIVPIVGGDAHFFMANFGKQCPDDLASFDPVRMNTYLKKGWIWSNGARTEELGNRTLGVKWRRVEPAAEFKHLYLFAFLDGNPRKVCLACTQLSGLCIACHSMAQYAHDGCLRVCCSLDRRPALCRCAPPWCPQAAALSRHVAYATMPPARARFGGLVTHAHMAHMLTMAASACVAGWIGGQLFAVVRHHSAHKRWC